MASKLQQAMDLGFRPYIVKETFSTDISLIEPGRTGYDEIDDSPGNPKDWWEKNAQRILLEIENMFSDAPPYVFEDFIVIYGNLIKRSSIVAMLRYEEETSFKDNKNRAFLTANDKRSGAKSVLILGTGAIVFTDMEYWFLSNYLI